MFCGGFRPFDFNSSGSLGFGWMFLAMGFRLLIFVGLIFLTVKLFKSFTNKSNDLMTILNEKFARGEISEEEYLKRKTILSQRN
ncbi:SHOCT domain-containing protein [Clostridium sp. MSJ-4]|uniref:SHOCT domain-containing protein n=1 Tax=Clostridium simiarum TaxID=2841506 RepID=A0ABS6EWW3_9CLOT|nr:SHOCT domain-containing protein [Clostridium simiarum]MBU5590719.1 SHOCT domain-containing protein [Clostridium simiarum]